MEEKHTPKEVRQGVTGHKVRYVLLGSLALVVVALTAVALTS